LWTAILFAVFLFASCQNNQHKIDTYDNLKKDLKNVKDEKIVPHANPGEFEREVNNGGLSQYFFNSSGQNCFETLRYFQKNGMTKEAEILSEAIKLINPKNLPEEEFIEKLRKRQVTELDDSTVNVKLDLLDSKYFK